MRATLGHGLLRRLKKTPPTTSPAIYDDRLAGFILRWRPSGRHSWLARTPRGRLVLAREAKPSPERAPKQAKACRVHRAGQARLSLAPMITPRTKGVAVSFAF